MNDLFGNPVDELTLPAHRDKPKKKYTPNGYASRPGSGPVGESCGTCENAVKRNGGRRYYWKCMLMAKVWTASYGTDIRLKSPACALWRFKDKVSPFTTL